MRERCGGGEDAWVGRARALTVAKVGKKLKLIGSPVTGSGKSSHTCFFFHLAQRDGLERGSHASCVMYVHMYMRHRPARRHR